MAALERWVIRGGAFALPLAYTPTTYDNFILPKLALARLLVAVLAVLAAIRWSRGDASGRWRPLVSIPVTALLASAALSTIVAFNRNVAVFGTYERYEGLITLATYAALFVLVAHALSTSHDARAAVRALIAGAYFAALIGIAQSLIGSAGFAGQSGETAVSFAGQIRAGSTLGNATALGLLLAMVLPVCLYEAVRARTLSARLIAINATVVITLGLALTFSRSAWLGAAVGIAVTLAALLGVGRRTVAALAVVVAGLAAAAATIAIVVRTGPLGALASRLLSFDNPTSGSGATRIDIWRDTVHLVAARPLAGWGPDMLGLVFPMYQTGNWSPGVPVDEAHSTVLQMAATQGVIGAACYIWVLAAFLLFFLRGRRNTAAAAMLGGVVAYQVGLQFNFSWLPSSLPFWLFAAAAVAMWDPVGEVPAMRAHRPPLLRALVPLVTICAAIACVIFLVAAPLAADTSFYDALAAMHAGNRADAASAIARARSLAPQESAYAKIAGDIALNVDVSDTPGPGSDPATAAADYTTAIDLGTFQVAAYRRLAVADLMLGRRTAAVIAIREAVALDPYDSLSTVLAEQLGVTSRG